MAEMKTMTIGVAFPVIFPTGPTDCGDRQIQVEFKDQDEYERYCSIVQRFIQAQQAMAKRIPYEQRIDWTAMDRMTERLSKQHQEWDEELAFRAKNHF